MQYMSLWFRGDIIFETEEKSMSVFVSVNGLLQFDHFVLLFRRHCYHHVCTPCLTFKIECSLFELANIENAEKIYLSF